VNFCSPYTVFVSTPSWASNLLPNEHFVCLNRPIIVLPYPPYIQIREVVHTVKMVPLYYVFTYIYSLLVGEYLCDSRNVLVKFLCAPSWQLDINTTTAWRRTRLLTTDEPPEDVLINHESARWNDFKSILNETTVINQKR